MAINSAQEVIVVGDSNIVVFNTEGRKVASTDLSMEHELDPFGLAVDSSDVIYVPCRATLPEIDSDDDLLGVLYRNVEDDVEDDVEYDGSVLISLTPELIRVTKFMRSLVTCQL